MERRRPCDASRDNGRTQKLFLDRGIRCISASFRAPGAIEAARGRTFVQSDTKQVPHRPCATYLSAPSGIYINETRRAERASSMSLGGLTTTLDLSYRDPSLVTNERQSIIFRPV
jgi:hypothetical protein